MLPRFQLAAILFVSQRRQASPLSASLNYNPVSEQIPTAVNIVAGICISITQNGLNKKYFIS
jgi:hypothetical protein